MQALRYKNINFGEKNDGKDNVISMTKNIVQIAWHFSGQLQVRKTLNLFVEFKNMYSKQKLQCLWLLD